MTAEPAAPQAPVADAGPGVGELAGRLRVALSRLSHALRAQNAEAGVTPTRIATLSVLDSAGPLRVGTLAERIGISPPAMTRLVDCLAELGHVRRDPDPDDQRAIRISIDAQGTALLAALRHRSAGLLAERIGGLDAASLAVLAEAVPLLEALADGDTRHR